MRKVHFPGIAIAFACLAMAACGPTKVPEQIGKSLRGVQSELTEGRAAIVNTTASLRNLRDNRGADIKPQFASFNENLSALESKAGGIQVVGTMTQDKANAYFQKWEQEINQIQDQDLAQSAQDRRREVMADFDGLKQRLQKLREAYRDYYASLTDVRTVLSADQTAQGAATARPAMDKAIAKESEVLSRLDAVNKFIGQMIGS